MKKNIIVILFFAIILVISMTIIYLQKNNYIVTKNNDDINIINNLINKIPNNITKQFEKDGWKIYIISKEEMEDITKRVNIAGTTMDEEKVIYIVDGYIEYALYHELGHYIDSKGNYSETEMFEKIYKEEVSKAKYNNDFGTIYSMSSISEYFANSVDNILTNEEKSKKYQPKTYEYILNIINEI